MENRLDHYEQNGPKEVNPVVLLVSRILETAGAIPVVDAPRPERCRAIVLSADGGSVAAIKRTRTGVEPYAVLPGGGLESYDASPVDGVMREIAEELSLDRNDFMLITDRVIVADNQWVYVGIADPSVKDFTLGGPELERNQNPSERGSYEPIWIPIDQTLDQNLVPVDIRMVILQAAHCD